ncbi:formin-like protein 5 [Lynx rufus]|uniref:formin-like protein 5 n=1 Tax=Lynx rufus TaxID=61384 RepID=UPI001F127FDC|nr:formin-like protein 5 [Lynx rufus]
MCYLPPRVGTKRKRGRCKLSKPHEGGITGGPILDFKLPETPGKRKPRPAHWLHSRAKEAARSGRRNSSSFAGLLFCCLPLPPLKPDPYNARPHYAPEPTQPKGAGLGLPAANSLQKGKDEGRQGARDRKKIRPVANWNPAADHPPPPAPGAPTGAAPRSRVAGQRRHGVAVGGATDLPKPPAPSPPAAPGPQRPGKLSRSSTEEQPAPQPRTGVAPGSGHQNAGGSQHPQASTTSLSKGSGSRKASPPIPSSFNPLLGEGRTLGPPNPQRHPPLAPVSSIAPELALSRTAACQQSELFFLLRLPQNPPPKPEREQTSTAPCPPASPCFHPPQPSASLNAARTSRADPSLSFPGARPPFALSRVLGTGARAPCRGDNSASPRARRPGPGPLSGRHSPGKHTT